MTTQTIDRSQVDDPEILADYAGQVGAVLELIAEFSDMPCRVLELADIGRTLLAPVAAHLRDAVLTGG
jgi:hypothetical protein